MKFKVLIAVCAVPILAACGGGGGGSSTPSTGDNPASTLVTVDFSNQPFPGIKVTLSTGLNNQTPTGVIATATTNSSGQVTFSLPATGTLCVSATETINAGTAFGGNCSAQPFPAAYTLSLNS